MGAPCLAERLDDRAPAPARTRRSGHVATARRKGNPRFASTSTAELLVRWCAAHEVAVRHEIARRYVPLISRAVDRYPGARMHRADALQVATAALLIALDGYDPTRGSFAAYAALCMRGALLKHLRDLRFVSDRSRVGRIVFLGAGRAMRRVEQRGEVATPETIAAELGVDVQAARRALAVLLEPVSLDACRRDGDADDGLTLHERIASDDEPPDVALERGAGRREIEAALDRLTARERQVIEARYFGDDEAVTLRDVGQQLGVSGERVRQLEARALAKLRAALRELGVGGGA
jgi:RNA polymerase sigma factor (sigma-70 family)